jgi:hypothetical protein
MWDGLMAFNDVLHTNFINHRRFRSNLN